MGTITPEALKTIRVLFRAPEIPGCCALYGLPYVLREGQAPRDLWRAYHDYVAPKPGHYGSKRIDISDWLWLGSPGWYGHLSKDEIAHIRAFLDSVKENVPRGPYEWCPLY